MPTWLLNALIPFAFQAFTPMLVLGAKWLGDWFKMKLPGPMVLVVASAIGETINQVGPALSGVEGLPPGTSAIVAVGLREFYSQMVAQPIGLETPSLEKQIEDHKEAVIEAKKPVPGQLGGTLLVLVALTALACGDGGDDSGAAEVLEANGLLDGAVSQDGTGNTQNVSQRDCSQDVTITGDGNTVNGPDCRDGDDNSGDDRDNSEETNEASSGA